MKVAILHYWLINMRGGEKMLESLLELYPEADIYTHVYDPSAVSDTIRSHRVYTTAIAKLPLAKKMYQLYLPLMPRALMGLNLQSYDLIISSEAGPAKGITPNPDAYHICYCHSPMRYCWDLYHQYREASNPLVRFFMGLFIPSLKIWDQSSANMVDYFVTNSHFTARRIKRYYRREAEVVYGPVELKPYLEAERKPEDFYLFFGQITPYKRLDIAIEACARKKRSLLIAGSGLKQREQRALIERARRISGEEGLIRFAGRVSEEEKIDLFSRARALIFPGVEDLGLVPIEANAAGCPVIAYKRGGVLDTIREGETGLFFDEQSAPSLEKCLDLFEGREAEFRNRELFTRQVQGFSKEAFKKRMKTIIEEHKVL